MPAMIIVQFSPGRVLALPKVNQMLIRYYAQLREAFVMALRRAVLHLAPHEVVRRYEWMGGSLMVALAVPVGMIEGLDGGGEPAVRSPHGSMSANLIAFLGRIYENAAGGQPRDPSGPGRFRSHHDQSCGIRENGSLWASSRAAQTGQCGLANAGRPRNTTSISS